MERHQVESNSLVPILLSMEVKNFAVWDYVVFAALFIISSGIGVFYAIKERKKATSREFLVGGRQMSFGPVALSLTASFMSAVTVLGTPADVYRFGASFVHVDLGWVVKASLKRIELWGTVGEIPGKVNRVSR